ncbi:unnamed protein product [Urochloa humidicola]
MGTLSPRQPNPSAPPRLAALTPPSQRRRHRRPPRVAGAAVVLLMPPSLPSYFSSGHRAALVLLPAARSMPRLSSGRLARRRSPTVPEAVGHGKRMGGGMPPWLHVEREPTLPIRPPQGCPPPPPPQIQSARAPRTSSAVHRPRRSRAPPPRSPPGSVKSSRARQREAMAACWGHNGRTSRIARHRPRMWPAAGSSAG